MNRSNFDNEVNRLVIVLFGIIRVSVLSVLYFGYHLLNLFRVPRQFDGVFLTSIKNNNKNGLYE